MKKILWILYIFILIVGTSCQEKIDVEKETEAIKAVIMSESNATHAKDFEKSSGSFLQDSSFIYLSATKYGYQYFEGWGAYSADAREWMESYPTPSTNKYEFSNFRIKVCKKGAYAIYDETVMDQTGVFLMKFINVRFLEKVDGEWKIAFMSFVNTTTYEDLVDDIQDEIERE